MVRYEATGLRELKRNYSKLIDRAAKSILDKGLTAATRPIITNARRRLTTSEESGALRKSLGFRKYTDRRSKARAYVIGPRAGHALTYNGEKRDPIRYAHLVEFGTRHSQAKPYLRPAFDAEGGRKAIDRFRDKVAPLIEQEARKIEKKGMQRI